MFFLSCSVTSTRSYIETLRTHLLPYLDNLPLARAASIVFQQDNAPAHRAHRTADFMRHNAVQTSPWPPLSPDLNPIELVWAAMKREVATYRLITIPAFRLEIRMAWNRILTPAFCGSLYARLPTVIKQIISVKRARV